MKEILMTDNQAQEMLSILKKLVEPVTGILEYGDEGCIEIFSEDNDLKFLLDYKYDVRKKVFNFRETKYNNYSLLRINLSNTFHKNSDGERVSGNRINVFSEKEYYDKGDGKTHMKAYQLPFNNIKDTNDFLEILHDLFDYTNTDKVHLNLSIQENLEI